MKKPISFDDILLVPQYSDISRSQVDLSVKLPLVDHVFKLPVVSASMDTITEAHMASSMSKKGGFGIIHRYMDTESQVREVKGAFDLGAEVVGAAIGVEGNVEERAKALLAVHKNVILCIDVAHGHHVRVLQTLRVLKNGIGANRHIMAGNIATKEGYEDLCDWGADSVKCGIGGGSICTTRIQTGHGVPTLQSIKDCFSAGLDVPIVGDGGFRTTGDIVKGIAGGATFVMLGSMLSGTDECPGELIETGGKKYKEYRGMASRKAQLKWRGRSGAPEGVVSTVPYRGSVIDVLSDIEGRMRSGVTLSGATSLSDLVLKAKYIEQTVATIAESSAHISRR